MQEVKQLRVGANKPAERLLAAAGLTALAAGSVAVWYFDPTKAGLFPVCPLYSFTGFACPGCGLTRGFHALFHGDVSAALGYNALLPFVAVAIVYIAFSGLLFVVRGRGLGRVKLTSTNWMYAVMLVVLTFGVVRNLPVYPFTLLFP